ncbi:CDP-diacylglycerol--glycerol-3-phosphate 3-phosphatidyltransferase [Paenibacillus allorhizosphaerae]|uniref:CDP-diacylglycerol--glycerol-3-phosphate 3-phosphatidyltransferase n=1 Tax=Paenibacillus allorhizosphaerae TaxID=2849866 RepID=A0ABN7TDX4_9BACL|nr:CDP-diacylglycerol--glycerol-3-phosphate 3-phosphatidyltransferase [Paenibacillus allorhizosphaerae]CAG7624512.1 CDP-diacylglycerol--glycerol-3-phosphate 3-phosphatidyltransferase [Paenibacillus allorhizosphaerae]
MNTANKITISRICLIPLFLLSMSPLISWLPYNVYIATAIFVLAAATDKLDGYVARKYNQVTNLGKLLDPLADKLLISAALIMLVQEQKLSSWIAVVIIGREILITAIRIMGAMRRIVLAADRYGKLKLVLQVAGIAAVLLDNYPFALFTPLPVHQLTIFAAVILTLYSGFNYIRNNYKLLELHT